MKAYRIRAFIDFKITAKNLVDARLKAGTELDACLENLNESPQNIFDFIEVKETK